MVLLGSLAEPIFFALKRIKSMAYKAIFTPGEVLLYIVWVGRSDSSDPARWFSILEFAVASCSLN